MRVITFLAQHEARRFMFRLQGRELALQVREAVLQIRSIALRFQIFVVSFLFLFLKRQRNFMRSFHN